MHPVLSIPSDISPLGAVIDIPWVAGKQDQATLDRAVGMLGNPSAKGIARKVAQQAAKMSLMAQLRKLEKGGHLAVLSLGEEASRPLLVHIGVCPAMDGEIATISDLKESLGTRTSQGVKYLQHHSLGVGGKTVGVSKDLNTETQVAYFAFMSADHLVVTEFEASKDGEDAFSAEELDALTELVKRTSLGVDPG